MKIIDFHTHIYPEAIAAKATQSTCTFYGLNTDYIGNAKTLLAEGAEAGITGYVLHAVATNAKHVKHINDFTAQEVSKHKEFYGFAAIHPDYEDFEEELDRITKLGLKGVKIHPDIQQFAIDDSRMDKIYDVIQGKLPIMIHMGDPRYDFSRPERLKKVLSKFPSLTVIGAHLGGWSLFDEALEYLGPTSCYVDISSCMMFIGKEKVKKYINAYGADRILFGSDFPIWSPAKEAEAFLSLGLSESDTEKIAYKNAELLLGL